MRKKQTIQICDCSVSTKLLKISLIAITVYFLVISIVFRNTVNFETVISFILIVYIFVIILNKQNKHVDMLEKITLTNDKIIITTYTKNKKENFRFNKTDINSFVVSFGNNSDSPIMYGSRAYANKYYTIQITIKCRQNDEYTYMGHFKFNKPIRSIFKVANNIPNFSYNIAPCCLNYFSEEIEKIANTGKGLNLIDIYNNPNISISEKKDILYVIIGVVLGLLILFSST